MREIINPNPITAQELADFIDSCFNESELHDLCFRLDIEYENLNGQTKSDKARELVTFHDRRGLRNKLINQSRELRPYIWTKNFENVEQTLPTEPRINPEISSKEEASYSYQEEEEAQVEQEIHKSEQKRLDISSSSSSSEIIEILIAQAQLAEKSNNHEVAAKLYAIVAKMFKQELNFVRAQKFARQSAQQYLKIGKKEDAIEQFLLAAEVWINQTPYAITMANSDLIRAEKLFTDDIGNSALRIQLLLQQAYYQIVRGLKSDAIKKWQEAEELLANLNLKDQAEFATELAVQKAITAELDGNREATQKYLEEADLRDWPPGTELTHLKLYECLLFYYSGSGNWPEADRIYESAQKLFKNQDENLRVSWLVHYASSLIRRGETQKAKNLYKKALDFFNSGKATDYQKLHFLLERNFSLIKHTQHENFHLVRENDSERMDLYLNHIHEDVGYLHRMSARASYIEGNTEMAFLHARHALAYSWRKGNWSGLEEAYKLFAFLYFEEKDSSTAIFSAHSGGDKKQIERFAPSLNGLIDVDEINEFMEWILQNWPTRVDYQNAFLILSKATDIVLPNFIKSVIQYTIDAFDKYQPNHSLDNFGRFAVQVLQFLAPQFNRNQTEQIIRFSLTVLNLGNVHQTIKGEFIQLIGNCFENDTSISSSLYQIAMDAIITFHTHDIVKTKVEIALLKIAKNAPSDVRNEIITFYRQLSEWHYLAILNEPIDKKDVKNYIQEVFHRITPHRVKGSLSFSGYRAQSINNFNDYISEYSLGDFVVDGLIKAIVNSDGFSGQKADAILALRWLPEEILATRSHEIVKLLFESLSGEYSNDDHDSLLNFFGSADLIHRNALYTLGHLYALLTSNELKMQIREKLEFYGFCQSSFQRLGTAMAFRTIKMEGEFSAGLTSTIIELLRDQDPDVRHWAASAVGHRIVEGNIPKGISNFITGRLLRSTEEEDNPKARAGVAYGLKTIRESDKFPLEEPIRTQVQGAMKKLENDVNYQVRRMATGK